MSHMELECIWFWNRYEPREPKIKPKKSEPVPVSKSDQTWIELNKMGIFEPTESEIRTRRLSELGYRQTENHFINDSLNSTYFIIDIMGMSEQEFQDLHLSLYSKIKVNKKR